jgi:hypothetical protein
MEKKLSNNENNQDEEFEQKQINFENFEKSRQYVKKNNYWNDNHNMILQGLQKNSNKLYREYQKAHIVYKKKLRLYRIPIIIMSSLSGFLSISNSGYIPLEYQQWISLFVGFVNLMVTLVSLIENFKKIDVNVNKTYTSYMEFKKLHDEISIMLNTSQNEREGNGYDIAMQFFNRYESYISDAPILQKTIHDFLDENSPDNSSQTFVLSGSDNISGGNTKRKKSSKGSDDSSSDNKTLDEYEDIESGKIPTSVDGLKKLLRSSNMLNNTGVIRKSPYILGKRKDNAIELANKKSKNTIQDRLEKVNRFQEQFDKMEKKVDNSIDKKVNKINLENNLNINQDNFPKLKNIKISDNIEPKTSITFGSINNNLINVFDDSEDDNIIEDSADELVNEDEDEDEDEDINISKAKTKAKTKAKEKVKEDSSSSTN